MSIITLYREEFKEPGKKSDCGLPEGYSYFDDVLGSLGVEEEKGLKINRIDITIDEWEVTD